MEVVLRAEHVRVVVRDGDGKEAASEWSKPHVKAASSSEDSDATTLTITDENGSEVLTGPIEQCVQDSQELNAINAMMNAQPLHIRFANKKHASLFLAACPSSASPLSSEPAGEDGKKFEKTRDSAAISEYFKYYAHLSQQQNMMGDFVRTSTYRDAMLKNHADFKDKVVLDVGAGSGLLSFFAAQAGARKVYAVEGSHMAECARALVKGNNLEHVITVLQCKVEDADLPEPVDVIISEPLGIMLVNERMLESYVHARKWLKPGGKMFPTNSTLFICPFSDANVFLETQQKAQFWQTKQFHGIDLTPLHAAALDEYLSQPCVEQINPECLVGAPVYRKFDYLTMDAKDFFEITMEFSYTFPHPVEIHGLASWFDNMFEGTSFQVPLSTSPYAPLTHWYQVRCLLRESVLVQPGDTLRGKLAMRTNRFQSYDVHIAVQTSTQQSEGHINLKEPNFRFGQFSSVPHAFPVGDDVHEQQADQHQQQAIKEGEDSSKAMVTGE